ncbi:hypothetical protein, partial [Bacteroides heparinolyticus]|uniref:hypothetical protein n=1 Tax=Prevotella heparinolytica TaxID=28113 RepID=UPI00359FFC97
MSHQEIICLSFGVIFVLSQSDRGTKQACERLRVSSSWLPLVFSWLCKPKKETRKWFYLHAVPKHRKTSISSTKLSN